VLNGFSKFVPSSETVEWIEVRVTLPSCTSCTYTGGVDLMWSWSPRRRFPHCERTSECTQLTETEREREREKESLAVPSLYDPTPIHTLAAFGCPSNRRPPHSARRWHCSRATCLTSAPR
jgi:hypothetical protein